MEEILSEYRDYLQSILDKYADMPPAPEGGAPISEEQIQYLKAFATEYNSRGMDRIGEILENEGAEIEDESLKDELIKTAKEYFNRYTQTHFKGIVDVI